MITVTIICVDCGREYDAVEYVEQGGCVTCESRATDAASSDTVIGPD